MYAIEYLKVLNEFKNSTRFYNEHELIQKTINDKISENERVIDKLESEIIKHKEWTMSIVKNIEKKSSF